MLVPGDDALDPALLWDFAVALLIGALIGVERERKLEEHPQEFGGLRTFMLIALGGALCALLSIQLATPWVFAAGLGGVVALVAVAYQVETRIVREVSGLTGEVAAIVTFLLAGAVVLGQRELAVMLGVLTTMVLTFKQDLHKVVRGLARDDVVAGLQLLFATFIVWPLLPDRALDPWGAFNPYRLWLLVVLISTLSLVGYAAVRLLGERVGMALTGLFGGIVSSTAVTLSFARQSRDPGAHAEGLALGLLLAWAVSFLRVLLITGLMNGALTRELVPPMLAMLAVNVLYLLVLWRQSGPKPAEAEPGGVKLRNPFGLFSAMRFGALFAVVLFVVALARAYLPTTWLHAVAILAGTTDVDAITLSMAEQASSGLDVRVAGLAILLAMLSNTAVKTGMVVVLGTPRLARTVGLGAGFLAVAGVVAWVVRGPG